MLLAAGQERNGSGGGLLFWLGILLWIGPFILLVVGAMTEQQEYLRAYRRIHNLDLPVFPEQQQQLGNLGDRVYWQSIASQALREEQSDPELENMRRQSRRHKRGMIVWLCTSWLIPLLFGILSIRWCIGC